MKHLITEIDRNLNECIENVKFYGLCHLIEDDNESVYPATIGTEAEKVTPNDDYEVTIYHRLIDGAFEPFYEESFGRRSLKQNVQRIRTVVFIKMEFDEHEDKIDNIVNSLPEKINLPEYEYSRVSNEISLIRDASAIWEDEFGEAYKDKFQKVYNIYALEYDCTYIKCPVCVG